MKKFTQIANALRTYRNPVRGSFLKAFLLIALAVLPVSTVSAHDFKSENLMLLHPFAAPTPPGAKVAAGYLTIKNEGENSDRLVGGNSSIAERLEIHKTVIDNDVARMRHLENGIELPSGSSVVLMPGDVHIMFVGLKQQLVLGERYEVTLEFETAGEQVVEFVVENIGTQETMDHSKMDHSKM